MSRAKYQLKKTVKDDNAQLNRNGPAKQPPGLELANPFQVVFGAGDDKDKEDQRQKKDQHGHSKSGILKAGSKTHSDQGDNLHQTINRLQTQYERNQP